MAIFEEKVELLKTFVDQTEKFDEIDKSLFRYWMSKKDNGNFSDSVNLNRDVYIPVVSELKQKGISMTESAMHFRWKKIKGILAEVVIG